MAGRDDGLVTVDAAAWQAAQRELAARERREVEHVGRERDALVQGALREGRITPVQARGMRRALDVDPEGTGRLLTAARETGGLPPNSAVPVAEIGTAGGDLCASPAEDALQRSYYERHWPGLVR